MYITSIVLDGFKSYGRRTEITGFDRQFNAVTGLNGTGKSNILDSICFVLGITNLTHVRATNLQDLIYKSGQAGVSKATVTIIFDNSDKTQSPAGFERLDEVTVARQIILGGKNKYLLNGVSVTNKRIQDLFCSVHLNVNNPHFLVMQGKITKVLNMKPAEILGMIEEAAGTKMYDIKRQVHMRTMEKKEVKLTEFESIFTNEIEPKLTVLREQREKFFEFQRTEREVDRLSLICKAWIYFTKQQTVVSQEQAVEIISNEIQFSKDKIEENIKAVEQLDVEIQNKMKEHKSGANSKLKELEEEHKRKQKMVIESTSAEKAAKRDVQKGEGNVAELRTNLQVEETTLIEKEEEMKKRQAFFDQLKAEEKTDKEALELCEKKYKAVSAGLEVNDAGEEQTFNDQIMLLNQKLENTNTKLGVYKSTLEKGESNLRSMELQVSAASEDYNRATVALADFEKERKNIEGSLGKMNYSKDSVANLNKRREALAMAIHNHEKNIGDFYNPRPYLRFQYTDPEPSFNRASVLGTVASLFKLKDRTYGAAIEGAAGGKLYNIVLDNDKTGKKLLKHGNLENRITFIPLNQIRGSKMNQQLVKFAQDLVGRENLIPAMDVVEYDPYMEHVMQYIFGNVFLARNLDVAKAVSYHKSISKRCVTLDGDVTDPVGVLSGGARDQTAPILWLLEDVKKEQAELSRKQLELEKINREIEAASQMESKYSELQTRLEMVNNQLNVLNDRLANDEFSKHRRQIEQMRNSIVEWKAKVSETEKIRSDCMEQIAEIKRKMENKIGHMEREREAIINQLKELRNKAEQSKKRWAQKGEEDRDMGVEIDELRNTISTTKENIEAALKNVEDLVEKHKEAKKQTESLQADFDEIVRQVKANNDLIMKQNENIQKIVTAKEKKLQENSSIDVQLKQLNTNLTAAKNEYKQLNAELKKCKKDVENVSENILTEARGLSNTEAQRLQQKLNEGKERIEVLKRQVNPKAQHMYEQEEKEFNLLQKRIEQVTHDKELLADAIRMLDDQKTSAITIAYGQVTQDLHSILNTLLPGAGAKLSIPRNHTILTGVEIKVSLSGVWKDSLNELSGGQRSLCALSFILAMLRFNPAPLYILDEVDAALDLSHTENVGDMLKQHFKQSQFIIVSLKEGMFTNANVLFKTQFIDGMSVVVRTENRR